MSSSSSSSSTLVLLINLVFAGAFGFSAWYMNFSADGIKLQKFPPKPLWIFGPFKFLTFLCLLIQLLNSLLHITAHLFKPLTGLRDLWFTCLALPIGNLVVLSFWGVWHLVGREGIFPVRISAIYPDWLNHMTHSVILPFNLLLLVLCQHRYTKRGYLLLLAFLLGYTILLEYIKAKSGLYVYGYLNEMSDQTRFTYYGISAICTVFVYKAGELFNSLAHNQSASTLTPKQKVKTAKSKRS